MRTSPGARLRLTASRAVETFELQTAFYGRARVRVRDMIGERPGGRRRGVARGPEKLPLTVSLQPATARRRAPLSPAAAATVFNLSTPVPGPPSRVFPRVLQNRRIDMTAS